MGAIFLQTQISDVQITVQQDSVGWEMTHQPVILPMTETEPLVYKILRARRRELALQKAASLTKHDSVKLNLIQLYPSGLDVFEENVLTRLLNPVDTFRFASQVNIKDGNGATQTLDSLTVLQDSLILERPSRTVKAENTLTEKEIASNGFDAQMDWLVPIMFLLVVYAGILRAFTGKYIANLFKSVFNHQNAESLYHTVNARNSMPSMGLDILFVLNMAMFAFLSLRIAGLSIGGAPSLPTYGLMCLAVAVLMIVKTGIYKFLGYVFNIGDHTKEFLFYVFLYTRVVALVLLPVTVMLPFIERTLGLLLVEGGVVLFVSMYLVQLLRGVKIFLRNPAAIFYMFLYLCALEILPVLVIYGLIKN